MGELGVHAAELHWAVGEFAARQNLASLIAVGPQAGAYTMGAMAGGMAAGRIVQALDAGEATAALGSLLCEGDVILVKGSHFMGLEKLVANLAEMDER